MLTLFDEVTPRNVVVHILISIVVTVLFIHSLGVGSSLMIAVSLALLIFKGIDTLLMLFGMAWNHANYGSIWERTF